MESGSAATQGFEWWTTDTTSTGAVASDSKSIGGSVRSIKCTNGASQGNAGVFITGALADAGRRITAYMNYSGSMGTLGAGGAMIFLIANSGGTDNFSVGFNSSAKLVIRDTNRAIQATGTTILAQNTDYRVSIVYTITSASVNTVSVYLNGVLEVSATNITMIVSSSRFEFNLHHGEMPANTTLYGAHFFIDDGTSGDPGDIHVTAKRPNANGTTNGFTTQIGSGGSGYGTGHAPQVNERPLSASNGWSIAVSGSAITEEYNIESLSQGDVNITGASIVDYEGWIYSSAGASETANIIVNNVQSNISLTSTNTLFTKIAGATSYPAGTGTDIGEVTATTSTTVSLYEAGILVAYIPSTFTWSQLTEMSQPIQEKVEVVVY